MSDEQSQRVLSGITDVLRVQLEGLHKDVKGMEQVLQDLTKAITRLAVMEERQSNAHLAIERAFGLLTKIEERVSGVEQAVNNVTRTSLWVDRGVWAAAAAGAMYIAKKTGLLL